MGSSTFSSDFWLTAINGLIKMLSRQVSTRSTYRKCLHPQCCPFFLQSNIGVSEVILAQFHPAMFMAESMFTQIANCMYKLWHIQFKT